MFTGIVEEGGVIAAFHKNSHSTKIAIHGERIFQDLKLGDSVAVNGVCLTVSSLEGTRFAADVMHETLLRSTLGGQKVGNIVNLERALRADGRFGGHIVSGHIDGTGEISGIRQDGNASIFRIVAPPQVMRYIVEKGSVAIDGISLTVASVDGQGFSVSVIPHTIQMTNLNRLKAGDAVNLECDIIGKYVERFLLSAAAPLAKSSITAECLAKAGF